VELIRIAVFGQFIGNALQCRGIRRIKQCSKVAIGLLPRHCPEPESGEQHRPMFNEVVGGVHNVMVCGI